MKYRAFLLIAGLIFCHLSYFSLAFADDFRYDSGGKRDPFTAPNAAGAADFQFSHGELRLEGLVVDQKGESYAIVNGEIVRQGEVFQGYLLKRVGANDVTFEKDDEKFDIVLRQEEIP